MNRLQPQKDQFNPMVLTKEKCPVANVEPCPAGWHNWEGILGVVTHMMPYRSNVCLIGEV